MIRTSRYKYTYRVSESRQELFGLEADPHEVRNLSGDPSVAMVERELYGRLFDWLLTTNRPVNSRDLQPGVLDGY